MTFKLLLLLFIVFYVLKKEKIFHLDKTFEDKSKYLKLKGIDYLHNSYVGTLKSPEMIFRIQMGNANKRDIEVLKQRFLDAVMNKDNFTYYKTDSKYYVQYVNKNDLHKCFLKTPPKSTGHILELIKKSEIQTLISIHDKTGDIYFAWNHGILEGLGSMKLFKQVLDDSACCTELKPYYLNVKLFIYSLTKCKLKKQNEPIPINLKTSYNLSFILPDFVIKNISKENGISFNSSLIYYILKLLKVTDCVIATILPGIKTTDHNSYGIIPFNYHYCDNAKEIEEKINNNYCFSYISNIYLLNYHLIHKEIPTTIDIIFSGFSVAKEEPKIGDMIFKSCILYNPNQSTPVSVFSCKFKDQVQVSISIKNKDVLDAVKKQIH